MTDKNTRELIDTIKCLEKEVEKFKEIAKESQGWDWLAAQDESDDLGIDYYTIDFMQELHEAVFGRDNEN